MIAAATARIAEESRRELPPAEVEAAPGVGSGTGTAGTGPGSPPTPPQGYAFVEHFGAMAKARIEAPTVDERQAERGPDWLHSPDAIEPPGAPPQPVYVTLMAGDTDGRWRRAMENLGAVVGGYDPALRVYRANAGRGVIEALAAADFVLAVEPIRLVEASHDTAVPAMGADALRAYDGAPGIFSGTGGVSVPIAVMDTGLNINHLDIASHRDSICGANFAYNSGWFGADGPIIEADDLWIDDHGHGTHVTATVAGSSTWWRSRMRASAAFRTTAPPRIRYRSAPPWTAATWPGSAATPIEGEEGSLDVDLLHATPEPGEPVFDARIGRIGLDLGIDRLRHRRAG